MSSAVINSNCYITVPARVEKLREVLDLTSAARSRGYLDTMRNAKLGTTRQTSYFIGPETPPSRILDEHT